MTTRDRKKMIFEVQNAPFRWFILQLWKGDHVFKKVNKLNQVNIFSFINYVFISINNRNGLVDISSGSRILVRGGRSSDRISYMNFSLKSCTAMASPKFRFGGWQKFSKNELIKDLKIFEKFIKNLHKNLKNLQNFSKIKFN